MINEDAKLPPVMHRSLLLKQGFTDAEIKTARGLGTWTRLHQGAYCATSSLAGLSREQQYRLRCIAVADRSPNLTLSHVSSAAMHGMPLWGISLDKVHLTRAGTGGGRATPGRIVHAGSLEGGQTHLIGDTRVTSAARTLIDTACDASLLTTVIAADAALRNGLTTPAEVAAALTGTRHRRGAGAGRRALEFVDGRSESAGESYTRVIIHQGGLPAPELQIDILGPDGRFIGRADLGYPAFGVLIEFDGVIKYRRLLKPGQRAEDVVIAEKLREDRFRDLGYVVVRIVWAELDHPDVVVARITAALDRGRQVVATAGILGGWAAASPIRIPA